MSTEYRPIEADRIFNVDPVELEMPDEPFDAMPVRDAVVIYGGAGANAEHFGKAVDSLSRDHPVHIADIRTAERFPYAEQHLVNTDEGKESLTELFNSGVVHAVYLSLIPRLHVSSLKEHLGNVGEGKADFVVIAKPAVQSIEEMKEVDAAKKAAEAKLLERFGPEYKPEANPMLYIHEHYKEKGAWHALREQLAEVTDRLGWLQEVVIDIQEARTAESEGRTAAFEGGALEDLGPHVISLGLDVQNSINGGDRYTIPNRSKMSVDRFRYQDSELPEGVETSFSVNGMTEIVDNETGENRPLPFVWRGGKGLVDSKEAVLVFEHPATGERTTITVDLKNNTLDVPDAVADLFPETQFNDNGYGYVVEVGLNGGDPRRSFQHWEEARVVTKIQHHIARQKAGELKIHSTGVSLHDLGLAALVGA